MDLLALVLLGGSCGAVGVWVLHFGQTILAESFAHALLSGLVLATLVGIGLFVGALIGVVLAYALILIAVRTPRVSSPTGISAAVTTLMAASALLASSHDAAERLEGLLFGDPLAISGRDLVFAALLALTIGAALLVFARRFAALAFDPTAAAALGINTAAVSAIAVALLAVTVSAAATVAGSLLALALVTGPAIGAAALARRLEPLLLLAAAAGSLGGAVGLGLARATGWDAPAAVALVLCAWALAASAIGAWRRRPRLV